METRYCPNCMRVLEKGADHRLCPNCGFDFSANPQPQNALPWYTRLNNRYVVGRVLGQGGFGITYIGFDTNLQCRVAIKEYYPRGVVVRDASQSHSLTWPTGQNTRQKESGCDSFLREARKMAKIGSIPGIVRVIDTFTDNDTSYIIMDYLEGVTLRKYIATNGCMSFERCFDMLRPLCGSIDRMHQKNMIHRDISPDNIMVRGDGTLWLLDFGAAKDIEVSIGTESSTVVAKRGFSPSEQYSGKNIGAWTDVYAMCATMYYCMSGQALPDVNERIQDESIPWNFEEVSDSVRNAFQQGLSIKYSDRIQSISELMDRLDGNEGGNKGRETDQSRKRDSERKQDNERQKDESRRQDGGGGHRPTEVVTKDESDGDSGFSISIDPFDEATEKKKKRKDLIKKAAVAAVAAVILIGGAAYAISNITNDSDDDEEIDTPVDEDEKKNYIEEKVYRYEEGGYGIYTGDWLDDCPNGSGTMSIVEEIPLSGGESMQAGAVYTCDTWEDGYMNGHGTVEFPDGRKYEGEWSDGVMLDGEGVMIYTDGSVYDGEWVNGLRDGKGVITYTDGSKYDGEWKDDVRSGQGTTTGADGSKYDGEWKDGLRNGQGTMTYADGSRYDGEWKDGLRDGKGVISYTDGSKYDGEWKNDLRDGHGTVTRANGQVVETNWTKGEQVVPKTQTTQKKSSSTSTNKSSTASTQPSSSTSTQKSTSTSTSLQKSTSNSSSKSSSSTSTSLQKSS